MSEPVPNKDWEAALTVETDARKIDLGKAFCRSWLGRTWPPPEFVRIVEESTDANTIRLVGKNLVEMQESLQSVSHNVNKLIKTSQETLKQLEFEERLKEGEDIFDVWEDDKYLKEEGSKATTGINEDLIPVISAENEVREIPENSIPTYADGLGVISRTEAEGATDRLTIPHPLPPVVREPLIKVSAIPQFAEAQVLFRDYLARVFRDHHYASYPPQHPINKRFSAYSSLICWYCERPTPPGPARHVTHLAR